MVSRSVGGEEVKDANNCNNEQSLQRRPWSPSAQIEPSNITLTISDRIIQRATSTVKVKVSSLVLDLSLLLANDVSFARDDYSYCLVANLA